MTEVEFHAKCPACGYQFSAGTLMTGNPVLEGANGVCCACGEILRVGTDRSLLALTAKEFLNLSAADQVNICILTLEIRKNRKRLAAQRN